MITRSQVSKEKEHVGLRRSVRLMNKQAKKQVVKEEHQRRVGAKKKARVQKKKATAREAKGKRLAAAGPHRETGRCHRQPVCRRGQIGSQALAGQAGPYDQAGPHSSQVSVKLPRGKEGMKKYDEGRRLNPNREDLCDCLELDCLGCFPPCPECQSTKCWIVCRHYRNYEDIAKEGGDVV